MAGGVVIGAAYFLGVLFTTAGPDISRAPEQWKILVIGGLGGLIGSIIDSLLGATLQYSGKDKKTGKIVEVYREGVVRISGKMILDNHSVNLVSSILTALILPKV